MSFYKKLFTKGFKSDLQILKDKFAQLAPKWEKFAFIKMADIGFPEGLSRESSEATVRVAKENLFNLLKAEYPNGNNIEKKLLSIRERIANTPETEEGKLLLESLRVEEKEVKIELHNFESSEIFAKIQEAKLCKETFRMDKETLENFRQLRVINATEDSATLSFEYAKELLKTAPEKHHEFLRNIQQQSVEEIMGLKEAAGDARIVEKKIQKSLCGDMPLYNIIERDLSKNYARRLNYEDLIEKLIHDMGKQVESNNSFVGDPLLDNHDPRAPVDPSIIAKKAQNMISLFNRSETAKSEDPLQILHRYLCPEDRGGGSAEDLVLLRQYSQRTGGSIDHVLDDAENGWKNKRSKASQMNIDVNADVMKKMVEMRFN